MSSIEYVSYQQRPDLDLQPIHQGIGDEPVLLHPPLEVLQQSYQEGLAIAMIDADQVVGYARFTPLLNSTLHQELNLPSDIPQIWEIGSAFIVNDPNYRGNGYYAHLRNSLLATQREAAQRRELLILGTTKAAAVLHVLPKAQEVGMDFYPCVHTEFEMIAPFTCVCSGEFGQGFQFTADCPARASQEFVDNLKALGAKNYLGNRARVPCTMYVSSESLARETDQRLLAHLGSRENLVTALISKNYYD